MKIVNNGVTGSRLIKLNMIGRWFFVVTDVCSRAGTIALSLMLKMFSSCWPLCTVVVYASIFLSFQTFIHARKKMQYNWLYCSSIM